MNTTTQLFVSLGTLISSLFFVLGGFIKYYLDAKIDPIAQSLRDVVKHLELHEGKIARLEEKTKKL